LKVNVAFWTFHFGENTGIVCTIATMLSPCENLADDVLNRHFLDVNVAHRQIVEQ
jgi:hypothetical protein